ncbi:MAG: hypothetical protein ACK4M3_07385 [Pyrobaculum sp.]
MTQKAEETAAAKVAVDLAKATAPAWLYPTSGVCQVGGALALAG